MSQQTINCPKCGAKIEITEVIAHEIEERLNVEFQSQLKKKEDVHRQELRAKEIDFQNRLIIERKNSEEQARKKAEESISIELTDLKTQLNDERNKREALQREELNLRKKQRELEDSKKNLELEMFRRLDEERKKIEELVAQ